MNKLLLTLMTSLLAGCASTVPTTLPIDTSHPARSQSDRVKFIILHYTVSDMAGAIKTLSQGDVSAHYIVGDESKPVVYQLVDESRQANHSGVSNWKNFGLLNSSSVGIEIVNPGYKDTPEGRVWAPFPQAQIDRLMVLLKEIIARHAIKPENILGHSDIAPQRKQDPGPMFPWHQLAAAGLVAWPDADKVAQARPAFELQLPDATWFQKKLLQHGYVLPASGVLDEPTRNVIGAFQMKYRPALCNGIPDAETAALLDVLTTAVRK